MEVGDDVRVWRRAVGADRAEWGLRAVTRVITQARMRFGLPAGAAW